MNNFHVYTRWVIHYGSPERVVCMGSTSRPLGPWCFATRREAVACADAHRYQRWDGATKSTPKGFGALIRPSDPRWVWPPEASA